MGESGSHEITTRDGVNLQEYERLQAERAEVEHLLSRIPAERVIDRRSLESRLTRFKPNWP
jgi:hypothetical protein